MTAITCPYLLVLNVPLHRHAESYWADPLWRKDLEAHLAEIADLSIACPVEDRPPPAGWERLAQPKITVVPLPAMRRWSFLALPYLVVKLWLAISRATIVHTGVAGWPFPLGWIAVPIARLRNRFLVLVVESAFWRIPPGVRGSLAARAKASVYEAVNRACIARCDVTFFTTASYRDTLHPDANGSAHVLPAVWVDADQLIGRDWLDDIWPAKALRMLFAGRLTAGKGLDLLLEAIRRSSVAVDIIGDGDLRAAVVEAQESMPELVRLLEPIEYGAPFFGLLDDYAAVIVPTITDEQPRIIFDAFARGVPVIASDTTGNRQIVEHGRNGLLYPSGDSRALADVLVDAASDPARLYLMGVTALQEMATRTHAGMHADRAATIKEAFSARAGRVEPGVGQ